MRNGNNSNEQTCESKQNRNLSLLISGNNLKKANLKKIRSYLKLSARAFAKKLNMPTREYNEFENLKKIVTQKLGRQVFNLLLEERPNVAPLKLVRIYYGKSQREFAASLNLTQPILSRLETGSKENFNSHLFFYKLHELYGLDYKVFFEYLSK